VMLRNVMWLQVFLLQMFLTHVLFEWFILCVYLLSFYWFTSKKKSMFFFIWLYVFY
jgi:hypothetical protein